MAHPNEEIARGATEALSKRDMEGFFGYQADDIVLHFPGRGPMAGEYRGKDGLAKLFQQQMEILDSPPEIETHDVLANDDHAVILNTVRATRGGQTLEHIEHAPRQRIPHRGDGLVLLQKLTRHVER